MNERIENPSKPARLAWAVLAIVGLALPAFSQNLESAVDLLGNPAVLSFEVVTYDYSTGNPLPGIAWFPQTGTTHDTVDAAEASGLPIGSYTRMDATIQGPATLTFWWKVASNNPLERLGFFSVDDSFSVTDNVDWQQRTVQVPCGEQVVSWYFDIADISNGPAGQNAAWVDEIVVTPLPNVPAIQSGLDNSSVEFYSEDWFEDTVSGATNGTVAKSGPIDPDFQGQKSTMLFDVEGPFEISFDWGIESNPDFDSDFGFEVDGVVRQQLIQTDPERSESFEYGPGLHCLSFTFNQGFPFIYDPENPSPYEGEINGYVDNMVITEIPASAVLADAVDVAPKVYGKAWYRQSQVTHDGADAACVSGLIPGDVETMYVELPDDAGLLSLWVKLSTEEFFGYLDVWVDGDYIGEYTGEQDWTKVEANLGPGQDRVLWLIYTRFGGGSGNAGDNVAYIDEIKLEPGASNFQPDLSIKAPKRSYKGNNRYNTSGVGQLAKYIVRGRRTLTKFKLLCQNSCPTNPDSMRFYGTRANRHFEILYVVKFNGELFNISAEFQTGQFTTETLEYLQFEPYEVWIAPKEGGRKRTQTARIRGVSITDPRKMDTVRARLVIPRRRR